MLCRIYSWAKGSFLLLKYVNTVSPRNSCKDRKSIRFWIKTNIPICSDLNHVLSFFVLLQRPTTTRPSDETRETDRDRDRDRGRSEEGEYVRYNWCKWGIQFQWCHSLQTLSTLRCCCMCVYGAHMSCTAAAFIVWIFNL